MRWEKTTLGNIVSISKGKKHTPKENGINRYINIENLHDAANSLFTDEKGTFVEEGDLIIAWDGANAGKVGVGFVGVIGSTLARLKIHHKEVHPKYLFWVLESKNAIIKSQRTGATIPHINGASLRSLEIPHPPLEVQKQIADTLDKADALRRKDEELLKKYDELAQSIFYDMFESKVENLQKVTLEKICLIITDGTHLSPKFISSGIPFLFVSNIKDDKVIYETDRYISEQEYLLLYKRTPIKKGDILLTTVGSYGNPVLIDSDERFMFQRHIAYIKPDSSKICSEFLFRQMKSSFIKRQIEAKVRGVAQKTLNLGDLKKIEVILPSIQEQKLYREKELVLKNYKEKLLKSFIKGESLYKSLINTYFS